jgi:tetratricopeptide (TPR) repeat protein
MDRAARSEAPAIVGEVAGYRLVRVVARGAQGTVYEAIEPRTGRRVAIKRLIRSAEGLDAADTATAGATAAAADAATTCAIPIEDTRFARETAVLAALAHPNIVSLLSAPESDGARLLVMEWIEGASFDRWADEVWAAREPAEALRVVVQALADTARAVAVAHAIGIVHRDIKPTNVLVGAGDAPKVLDFGLAKEIGTVDATRTQGFAGTPSWCAPEQIDGHTEGVDARTDVHALGLLAFRALTGRAAFDPMLPIGTLFEAIRHAVPAFTAADRRRVPNELALVALRALEKDSARRYANASALADDLERFLAGEPVEAHPPGALYVARTLVRRHRAAAFALAVAILAIVVGAAAALVFAVDASRARDAEKARADEAVAARVSSERMNDYFRDLLANLRERDAAGTPTTAAAIVKLAVSSLESRPTQPEVERDLRETLAQVLFEIGDYEESSSQYERLLELAPEATLPLVRARAFIGISENRQFLGPASMRRKAAAEAIAVLDRIPAAARSALQPSDMAPSNNPDYLRSRAFMQIAGSEASRSHGPAALEASELALRFARSSGYAPQVASALSTRALTLGAGGDFEAAAAAAKEAVVVARDLQLEFRELSRILNNAGYLLTETGGHAEAMVYLDEAYELRVREFGPSHPRTIGTGIQRTVALRGLKRFDEAITLLMTYAEIDPSQGRGDDELAPAVNTMNALRHLGTTYLRRGAEGDAARAIDTFERAIGVWCANTELKVHRLARCAQRLLTAIVAERGQEAAIDHVKTTADRARAISGRTEDEVLVRVLMLQRLMEPDFPRDAWRGASDLAQCRADAALLIARFDEPSEEAFEGELTLLLALERSDGPALAAEGSALRSALEQRTAANFGEQASRMKRLAATRPKTQ